MEEASAGLPHVLAADGRPLSKSGWVQPTGATAPTSPRPAPGCSLGFLGAKLLLSALRKHKIHQLGDTSSFASRAAGLGITDMESPLDGVCLLKGRITSPL